jgi:SNF2 family DNA or RNA helicase
MSNPNFDYSDPEYSNQEEKKFDNIPMIEQPEKLKTKLYIHQLASVYEMEKLEESKLVEDGPTRYYVDIGINADMTGYGKTVSMVALVLRDKMTWDNNVDYALEHIHTYASQHVKKIYTEFYPKINTTLVLASHSIIHQWENEFLKTNLRVGVVKTKKAVQQVDVNNYDVIIVSSTMCNLLLDKYWNIVCKRFIYDEPTTLRIPSMKRVIAGFTWLITATPDDIYPNYRSTRRNYMSEILGDRLFHYYIRHYVTIKNDDNFITAVANYRIAGSHVLH